MAKFRYYIDLGSGYVLTDIYNNTMKLKSRKFPSLMTETKELSGSFQLAGDNAEDAFELRTTSYIIPFKIEEYNGSSWNTLWEGNANIGNNYKRNSRTLEINEFVESETLLTKITSALNVPYKTDGTVWALTMVGFTQTITSTRLDIVSAATALTPTQWQAAFDLEGNAITATSPDARWANFGFFSTTSSSPTWVHTWTAYSFTFRPGTINFQQGYNKLTYNDLTYWCKAYYETPTAYNDESWSARLCEGNTLEIFLHSIFQGIDSTLGFNYTLAGDLPAANLKYFLVGDTFEDKTGGTVTFTLEDLLDFIKTYYSYDWYIGGLTGGVYYIEFKNNAHVYYNSSLDWTSDTSDIDNIEFAHDPMPDTEKWSFLDESLDRFLVSYYDKGIPTKKAEFDYSVDMYQDFWKVLQTGGAAGKFVYTEVLAGVVNTLTTQGFFNLGGINRSFCSYDRFVVPTNSSSSYTTIPDGSSGHLPVYSLKHDKWIDDYSAFDLFSRINLSGLGYGFLNSYEIDLNSGIGTFDIWYEDVTIAVS